MHKIHTYDKILSPIVTEKSTNLSEQNKIVFKVPNSSNKKIIKLKRLMLKPVNKLAFSAFKLVFSLKNEKIKWCKCLLSALVKSFFFNLFLIIENKHS